MVHPMDLDEAQSLLAVVNQPAGRLELFDATGPIPQPLPGGQIAVGIDPVTVRIRPGTQQAWVVNKVSDSISIVDLTQRKVLATLRTGDDPSDVVFAGTPERAFVSCSLPNELHVHDPDTLQRLAVLKVGGNRPRSLSVSPDGRLIHVALFESGNRTTIIGGGHLPGSLSFSFPPDATANSGSPYNGQTPPPNDGNGFSPPVATTLPPPPNSGIIVRMTDDGRWLDDNNGDWTSMVSGSQAHLSGRSPGWTLIDRDIATLDTQTMEWSYTGDLMNMVMAMTTAPDGAVLVVGTDARNQIRFEPNLKGRFLDVLGATVHASLTTTQVKNLNGDDFGSSVPLPMAQRKRSVGDPRAVLVHPNNQSIFVAGLGSNNLTRFHRNDWERQGDGQPLELGEGPSGLIYHSLHDRLYVFNRFDSTLSVVDPTAWTEVDRLALFDPTPVPIREGREFLFNTIEYSGTGHVSCASCHIDARMDKLAWDLGDPSHPEMFTVNSTTHNIGGNFSLLTALTEDSHPMKGPMVTQTLQDIIGMEPLHWRGDRLAFEDFNATFVDLQANDRVLDEDELGKFKEYIDTLLFPPNPYRNVDNTLKWRLPIPDEFSTGRFSPSGTPLPEGRPNTALALYIGATSRRLDANVLSCAACHTLPTGAGTNKRWTGSSFVDIPPGPRNEAKVAVVGIDGSLNRTIKVPHLRNMHERNGMTMTTATTVGFGFVHDGSVDSLPRFFSDPRFTFQSDQEIADMVALMLSWSGSNLGPTSPTNPQNPPGPDSNDTPAGLGVQWTAYGTMNPDLLTTMTQLATAANSRLDLIAKAQVQGQHRGWWFDRIQNRFLSDRNGEIISMADLLASASAQQPMTFTLVLRGTGRRLGIDADLDGFGDRTEKDTGTNHESADSIPPRAMIAFSGGSDLIASQTTVTTYPKTVASQLEPLSDVGGTIWHVDTNRTGWTTATLHLRWTPDDVAGFTPQQLATMKIFRAASPLGPWTPLPTNIDLANQTAWVEVDQFSWFAVAQSSVPVSLKEFYLD